jgi:hypothetical protein
MANQWGKKEKIMKKSEKTTLLEKALALAGKRRNRTIGKKEIEKLCELDRKTSLNGKSIRVYSRDGFVANSYNKGFFTPIDFIERWYDNGVKKFTVSQAGANRSHGNGALVTVNGKAY